MLARLVTRGLDLGPAGLRSLPPGEQPDFVRLTWSSGANLLLRYGFILGLAFIIGWWHRQRRARQYGVTMAGRSFSQHFGIGLLLFATAWLPSLLLKYLGTVLPLGPMPAHWAQIQDLSQPGIWLYLAVGSFGLVPILEEVLARGYIQTRLSEDFGVPAAILITAIFFTLSHTQYFLASAMGIGFVASLFVAALGIGYVRYRTGSLWPGIIAHACGNLPFRGWALPALLILMMLALFLKWRAVSAYVADLWHEVFVRDAFPAVAQALVLFGVLLGLAMFAPRFFPIFAGVALLIAIVLEFREKQAQRKQLNSTREAIISRSQ